ncbi:MAG TPA: ribulose-phosphate 3-epimerase [Pirellulales bacterium]|nr:ribulose-phosphate 3-epimerase [Pirellulales bacterium]
MSRRDYLADLRTAIPAVYPSMLMCDFGHLKDEVDRLGAAGTRVLHLDVMDGHFVPNLSYGLTLVEAFAGMTRLPLEAHLMISNPGDYIERYFKAGASSLIVHAEAVENPRPILETIRGLGAVAGLAINPPTPVDAIRDCLDVCDQVLVMSVMPGFGGQEFDRVALDKLRALRRMARPELLLEIDGGVNEATLTEGVAAGAQLLVIGSGIFKHHDYQAALEKLTALAHRNRGG